VKVVQRSVVEVRGLGAKIKRAREADPRSVKAIATLAKMTPQNWYRVEAEEQELPRGTLMRMEAALMVDFGVSFDV